MRLLSLILHVLKFNIVNVIVQNLRSHLIDLKYLTSPAVHDMTPSTNHPDEYANECFSNNFTGAPL